MTEYIELDTKEFLERYSKVHKGSQRFRQRFSGQVLQSYIQLLGIQFMKFLPWKYNMENNILLQDPIDNTSVDRRAPLPPLGVFERRKVEVAAELSEEMVLRGDPCGVVLLLDLT
jgi:hypothetical protein